jgi:plasmid stability protein
MSTMTIRLPDAQHERLKLLARSRGVSVNKFVEEITTRALTEFDVETRFRVRAARGDIAKALALIDRLDAE